MTIVTGVVGRPVEDTDHFVFWCLFINHIRPCMFFYNGWFDIKTVLNGNKDDPSELNVKTVKYLHGLLPYQNDLYCETPNLLVWCIIFTFCLNHNFISNINRHTNIHLRMRAHTYTHYMFIYACKFSVGFICMSFTPYSTSLVGPCND